MTRYLAYALAAGVILSGAYGAYAAEDAGARTANGAYVPSTHSQGCSGVLCDGNDPHYAVGAPPPPPCQGLLCSVSPYGLQRPVTAGEVQRVQEERARAAAVAAPAPPPEAPVASGRRHGSKSKSVKAKAAKTKKIAARTADPGPVSPSPQ